MKVRIVSLQFALFFKEVVPRPDTTFADFNQSLGGVFDAIPTILPIPKELPPDVPLVVQKSSSGSLACNISRSRIDLFAHRVSDDVTNAAMFKDFNVQVNSFQQYVTSKTDIVRFGLICRYFIKDENAIATIRAKYFKEVLGDVSELSLRYNQKEAFQTFEINDVVEISAAQLLIVGQENKGILIQRDINNVPQGGGSISSRQLQYVSGEFSGRLAEKQIEDLIR